MKMQRNKRFKLSTGYNYLTLAVSSDGKVWQVTNGLVQPGYSEMRFSHTYKTLDEAEKQYSETLERYTSQRSLKF